MYILARGILLSVSVLSMNSHHETLNDGDLWREGVDIESCRLRATLRMARGDSLALDIKRVLTLGRWVDGSKSCVFACIPFYSWVERKKDGAQ